MEAAQPEAFLENLYKNYSMKDLELKENGAIHGLGKILFDPNDNGGAKGQTGGSSTFSVSWNAGGSHASLDVMFRDMIVYSRKYPFVRELPQAFFVLMGTELDGLLAEDYRGYIRHEVKPALDRMKDIIHAHWAAIEQPPLLWLMQAFPGHNETDRPSGIAHSLVSYARAWDRVLAQWDVGKLDELYPPKHMMPWLALFKLNVWCVVVLGDPP
eukprot:SAG31_NODE_4538_length_3155_cov_5.869437_2_plen_213_part_00